MQIGLEGVHTSAVHKRWLLAGAVRILGGTSRRACIAGHRNVARQLAVRWMLLLEHLQITCPHCDTADD